MYSVFLSVFFLQKMLNHYVQFHCIVLNDCLFLGCALSAIFNRCYAYSSVWYIAHFANGNSICF